jgi:hypothetical protein
MLWQNGHCNFTITYCNLYTLQTEDNDTPFNKIFNFQCSKKCHTPELDKLKEKNTSTIIVSGPQTMIQQYGPTILHKLQILWTNLKMYKKKKSVQNILASKPSLLVAFTVTENQVFSKLASFFYCNSGTDCGILLKAKSHNNEDKIIS